MENQTGKADGQEKKRMSLKEFFSLGDVGAYFFRKKDPAQAGNINLRIMHGINRFAILVFLAGMIYFIIKRLF